MPNTKSAERRARVSVRRQARNRSISSRLHTLEKKYRALVASGKQEEASKALRSTVSALDKAAKRGVIPKRRADRKKSRLAVKLNAPAAKAAKA
ncbi:MAG: 30S ribosomal protein S20 [Verrucomicrobiales bacterium]|nr:30S ribosomal protein S20 [Verrucomicrobiales bacterium]